MKLNTENYKEVLNVLRLPEYWEERLRNKTQQCNAQTLRVLDQLGENISGTAVSHKVYSNNDSIRKHAKSVFMKFSSSDAFKFLENDFDDDFNALDEVRIHTSLRNKAKVETLPLLIRWVNLAKNENYKAFLIREIGYFKQIDSAPRLIEMYLDCDSIVIKKQIVETLGKLKCVDAVSVFINDFEFNEQTIQNEIIDALGSIGGKEAVIFLDKLYHHSLNKESLVRILNQIYLSDTQGEVYTKIKKNAQTDFEKAVIAYVELNTF